MVLSVSGACARIMITNSISVVGPNMPELFHERPIFIPLHFLKQIHLSDVELIKNELNSQQSNFSLKEVSPVKTIQAVSPKDTFLLTNQFPSLMVTTKISKILINRLQLLDNLIHLFKMPT